VSDRRTKETTRAVSAQFAPNLADEPLTFPSVAVCERRAGAIDTQIESNRIGGYIKERQFAGCVFYWHENNTSGD
jgi:hypothetical protein